MAKVYNPIKVYEWLRQKKQAFQLVASQPAGQLMLGDLARFCRAYESCFHPDPRVHARLEGRRDVWLHIQSQLKLSDEQLYAMATNGAMPPSTEFSE